jgi:MFS family permease
MSDMDPGTPPTELPPDFELPDEPPRWPKVVGVTSIIFGALSLTCGGMGLVMMGLMPVLMKAVADQMGPMPDAMKPNAAMMVAGVIGLGVAVLLIIAGIVTVQRKPAGRRLHLVYAVLGIASTFVGLYLQLRHQAGFQQWAAQNPDNLWAQQGGGVWQLIGLAFSIFLGFGWPLFCLIWFGLVKTRAEHMTGGEPEPAA